MNQSGGGGQTGPAGPNGNSGVNAAPSGGAPDYSWPTPRGSRPRPSFSADFAARIASRPRWLIERLTRYLRFTLPNQQPDRLPIWRADSTGLAVDEWVDRILSPIQDMIIHLRSKFERSSRSGEPLNFTWASRPERMFGGQPAFTDEGYTDDTYGAGHPDAIPDGYPGRESDEAIAPQLRQESAGVDSHAADSAAVLPGPENRPPHKIISQSLLRLDSLIQRISPRLTVPVQGQAGHDHIISPQEDVSSVTHHPRTDEVLPAAGDPTHHHVSGLNETLAAEEPEGITGHDLTGPRQQARQTRRPSSSPDLSRLLLDKSRRVVDLSTVWSHLARRGESIESSPGITAPAETEGSQEEQKPTRVPLRGSTLENSLTSAADHYRSAIMIDANSDIAKKPGAGPGREQTAEPGQRPNEAEERRVSEGAFAVHDIPSRAPYRETGTPLSFDIVHRYRIPMRQMSMKSEEGSSAFAAEGAEGPRLETAMPGAARGSSVSGPRPFMPGLPVGGRLPFGFSQPAIAEARLADDQKTLEFPFEKRFAILPEDYPSFAGPSLTRSSLLDSMRREFQPPRSLSPVGGEGDDAVAGAESDFWESRAVPVSALEAALQFPTAQAGHGKWRASGGELPVAVFAGSPQHSEGATASVATASLNRPTGGGDSGAASASAEATTTAAADQSGAPSVDIDSLARDVYQIIKRRLSLEKERRAFGS